jgi:hypothetical protein
LAVTYCLSRLSWSPTRCSPVYSLVISLGVVSPSYEALLASTVLLWSSPSFLLGSVPASHLAAQTDMCSGSLSFGEVMGIAATIPNWSKGWPHWYWLSWLLPGPLAA